MVWTGSARMDMARNAALVAKFSATRRHFDRIFNDLACFSVSFSHFGKEMLILANFSIKMKYEYILSANKPRSYIPWANVW